MAADPGGAAAIGQGCGTIGGSGVAMQQAPQPATLPHGDQVGATGWAQGACACPGDAVAAISGGVGCTATAVACVAAAS